MGRKTSYNLKIIEKETRKKIESIFISKIPDLYVDKFNQDLAPFLLEKGYKVENVPEFLECPSEKRPRLLHEWLNAERRKKRKFTDCFYK